MDKWMQEAFEARKAYVKRKREFGSVETNVASFTAVVATAIASAVRDEREACAKVAEQQFDQTVSGSNATMCGKLVAAAIRSREDKA